MLTLSRLAQEEVWIEVPGYPNRIVVTVLECRSGKVRLGFSAPPEVVIHRREVVEKIEAEGRRSP